MTDDSDDQNRPRQPRTRSSDSRPAYAGKPRTDKPYRAPSGDRPPFRKPREGGERPRAPYNKDESGAQKTREAGDRPFRTRDETKPYRRPYEGDRPRTPYNKDAGETRKPREPGDRPFRARDEGAKPFHKPRGARDRSPRAEGERSFHKPYEGKPYREKPRSFEAETPQAPAIEAHALEALAQPVEDRIAKVIARAGLASRRDAEAMIAEGRVTLNGEVLTSPAINVTASDVITVDGEPLPSKERTRLWLYHKPRGLVTTARDPEGRATVFDHLPEDLPRVITVGRLDINTEGLLLLTNDGGLARVIAHPETGWLRRYKVRAHGETDQAALDALRGGISIDRMDYGPIEAHLDRVQGDNIWITMGLREGKNREVKRILEYLGLRVNRLIRLSFGPFQLGEIEQGLVEEVRTRVLKDQLGDALAAEAEVDFEAAVREPIAPFGPVPHEKPFFPNEGRKPQDNRKPRRAPDADSPRERPRASSFKDPAKFVWHDSQAEERQPRGAKAPRRGEDAHEARKVSGERRHERVGAVEGRQGRKVVVERLIGEPAPREERSFTPREGRGQQRPRSGQKRTGGGENFSKRPHGPRKGPSKNPPRDRPS